MLGLLPLLAAASSLVIGPGQEPLVMHLVQGLGTLPGDCRLTDLPIERDRIVLRLACAKGQAEVALVQPSAAAADAPRTPHFAVVPLAGANAALAAALAARLRPRDDASPWSEPASPGGRSEARAVPWMLVLAWPLVELVRLGRQRRRTTR